MLIEESAHGDAFRPEDRVAVAVAMRLHAVETTGKAVGWYAVLSTLAVIYLRAGWPFAIGLLFGISTYGVLVFGCVRRVQSRTGMSPATQAFFVRRYKSDAEFARTVDRVDVGMSSGDV